MRAKILLERVFDSDKQPVYKCVGIEGFGRFEDSIESLKHNALLNLSTAMKEVLRKGTEKADQESKDRFEKSKYIGFYRNPTNSELLMFLLGDEEENFLVSAIFVVGSVYTTDYVEEAHPIISRFCEHLENAQSESGGKELLTVLAYCEQKEIGG